jgi:hypothetical protein
MARSGSWHGRVAGRGPQLSFRSDGLSIGEKSRPGCHTEGDPQRTETRPAVIVGRTTAPSDFSVGALVRSTGSRISLHRSCQIHSPLDIRASSWAPRRRTTTYVNGSPEIPVFIRRCARKGRAHPSCLQHLWWRSAALLG